MSEENVWKALSIQYLTNKEILEAKSANDKKKYMNLIKKRIFDDLWERMQEFGETNPPFIELNDSKFLRFDRKSTIFETDSIEHAKLEFRQDRFLILIDKRKNDIQKRTLIAHEIGHTFLYDLEKIPIKPLFSRDRAADYFEENRSSIYSKEEAFIYEIARHILVPSYSLEREYFPKNLLSTLF